MPAPRPDTLVHASRPTIQECRIARARRRRRDAGRRRRTRRRPQVAFGGGKRRDLARRASTAVPRAFRQIRRTGAARVQDCPCRSRPLDAAPPPPQLAVLRRDLRTLRRARAIGAAWRTYCSLTGTSCAPRRTPPPARRPECGHCPDALDRPGRHGRDATPLDVFRRSHAFTRGGVAIRLHVFDRLFRGRDRGSRADLPGHDSRHRPRRAGHHPRGRGDPDQRIHQRGANRHHQRSGRVRLPQRAARHLHACAPRSRGSAPRSAPACSWRRSSKWCRTSRSK